MGTEDAAEVLKSGVYRIDLGNGWFYVGSASDLKQRERQHRRELERGSHCNIIVQRVYGKYRQFTFTILGRYPTNEILDREQCLLDEHCQDDKCANIAPVAGSCLGVKHSAETRANMSAAAKQRIRRPHTPETRAAISAAKTGKKLSSEHCAKLSAAQTGKKRKPLTSEHRAKISRAHTGMKHSDESRAKISAVQIGKKMPPRTPEHRAKISAAKTEYWARVREAAAAAL